MVRRNIYHYFFLGLLVFVLYGILELLAPFAGALLGAFLCAITFYPMYQALRRWLQRPTLRAAVADLLVAIFFIAPLILLAWVIIQEAVSLTPVLREGSIAVARWRTGNVIESVPWLSSLRNFLAGAFGIQSAQFQENIVQAMSNILESVSLAGTLLAKHAVMSIVNLVIMLFSLFFMFRNGKRVGRYILGLIPMRREDKKILTSRIHDMVIGVVRGWFLTTLVQGLIATLGYAIIKTRGAVLLGALTMIFGFVPVVGTFGIWVPVGIFYLLTGSYLKGVFILLWGAFVVVGVIDTLLRPYLVGKK